MIAQAEPKAAPQISAGRQRSPADTLLAWSVFPWLVGIGIGVLYAPSLIATAHIWLTNDSYAHGVFVYPLALFILWMQRDALRSAVRKPEPWGLLLLGVGLILETGATLLRISHVGMWSLVPTLAGAILALWGRDVWRLASFPVWFLLFADPIPTAWLAGITRWIQSISTEGSFALMSTLGFPLLKYGNVIQVPGASLEVAEACSGFHKLLSLLTFATLYCYLCEANGFQKLALLAAAIPIAITVNILRISSLIAAASMGGLPVMHLCHDPAEFAAIGIGFGLFLLVGGGLGCKAIKLSPLSAA